MLYDDAKVAAVAAQVHPVSNTVNFSANAKLIPTQICGIK
jgi:hypothetical protein